MPGPEPREKTELEKLSAKRNGIARRINDPRISQEERSRARIRLVETDQRILELRLKF